MPYIPEEKRERLRLNSQWKAIVPGELNFQITMLVLDYLDTHDVCYDTLNDVMGVLGCVKEEFYRRIVVPYEEGKIAQNGDVYPEVDGQGGWI